MAARSVRFSTNVNRRLPTPYATSPRKFDETSKLRSFHGVFRNAVKHGRKDTLTIHIRNKVFDMCFELVALGMGDKAGGVVNAELLQYLGELARKVDESDPSDPWDFLMELAGSWGDFLELTSSLSEDLYHLNLHLSKSGEFAGLPDFFSRQFHEVVLKGHPRLLKRLKQVAPILLELDQDTDPERRSVARAIFRLLEAIDKNCTGLYGSLIKKPVASVNKEKAENIVAVAIEFGGGISYGYFDDIVKSLQDEMKTVSYIYLQGIADSVSAMYADVLVISQVEATLKSEMKEIWALFSQRDLLGLSKIHKAISIADSRRLSDFGDLLQNQLLHLAGKALEEDPDRLVRTFHAKYKEWDKFFVSDTRVPMRTAGEYVSFAPALGDCLKNLTYVGALADYVDEMARNQNLRLDAMEKLRPLIRPLSPVDHPSRDHFERACVAKLARRVLLPCDLLIEELVLIGFRNIIGTDFASKMLMILKDKAESQRVNNEFRTAMYQLGDDAPAFSMEVQLMLDYAWPEMQPLGSTSLPTEMAAAYNCFTNYLAEKFPSKKLVLLSSGTADIEMIYPERDGIRGSRTLIIEAVPMPYLSILNAFAEREEWTVTTAARKTGIPAPVLMRYLATLTTRMPLLLERPDGTLVINQNFGIGMDSIKFAG